MDNNKEKKQKNTESYSIKHFLNRVMVTFLLLTSIAFICVYLLIYKPLKVELEKSLVENFRQISYLNYSSLEGGLSRSQEGAKSLSSRTVIRDAIVDYRNGDMNLQELQEFTSPKYSDGARVLDHLVFAERTVDNQVVAKYIRNSSLNIALFDENLFSDELVSYFIVEEDYQYTLISSPIVFNGEIIGYDKVVYDCKEHLEELYDENKPIEIIKEDKYILLAKEKDLVSKNSLEVILEDQDSFYYLRELRNRVYLLSSMNNKVLLEPVNRIGNNLLIATIITIGLFTLAIYLLIIRFARDEIIKLEGSRISLKKVISEVSIDSLTGASSRLNGEEVIQREFNNFLLGKASPAIMIFDLDGLKQINDTHGHIIGDETIKMVAREIINTIRKDDLIIRWGGDEFVGILYGLEVDYVFEFSEKILNRVSSICIKTSDSFFNPTISIGISYFKDGDTSYLEALNRADTAMYKSKIEGKNISNILLL